MRPMLGRLKNRKNRKNFGVQKNVRQVPASQGFERFFGPGPIFRKMGEKKRTPRIRRKWSHRPQDKPWEPCACFPDYGRGQALTPSNLFGPKIVELRAILAIFRPFEISRKFVPYELLQNFLCGYKIEMAI